ncbi:heme ABC transporter ATP-binding protein [Brevibacterium aurantiacum]|uniref:Heme ABC transporter ATP-binding protein n=1 Tax=Brevibacterium aurantiacum TaxID=273384 RepID=A0A556CAX4_BREAU|nr:heme ABC transporter ATP-binding protein [Brevibacterium aurantiacum]TSI14550.1 heme ABC transporter ATP-binding protein [Brevibacterium aurantiacum]
MVKTCTPDAANRTAAGRADTLAEAIVRAQDVTFAVDGRELVTGISFALYPGEVVALVGPNGAGKSTMLSLLSGDVAPTRGTIEIVGVEAGAWKSGPLARQRSVMLQHNSSNFAFSVKEAVHMGRLPWNVDVYRDEELVAEAITDSDLHGFEARDITTLSGGEAARVSYARTKAQTTPIIFLDEPTAALDLRHQESLLRSVKRLSGQGAAVIVVLHDLNLALRYAERVLVFGDGRLVADGPPSEALSEDLVEEVYGQRVRRIEAEGVESPILIPV